MEKEILCAFSSNSRNLYKADIYRALSMPEGYILHFRYKSKYVDDRIKQDHTTLVGKKVYIFYAINENGEIKECISVREAIINHIEHSKDTDLYHIYMKLGEFAEAEINIENKKIYFGYNKLLDKKSVEWKNRIDKIKDFFDQNIIYFFIKSISKKGGKIQEIKNKEKYSYYELTQGQEYSLNLALANPIVEIGSSIDNSLLIETNNDDIVINYFKAIELSAQYDDIEIPLFVKYSDYPNIKTYIIFKPQFEDNKIAEFISFIKIEKQKNLKRSIKFGLFSILALIGFFLVKNNSQSLQIIDLNSNINFALIIGFILILCSAAGLHYYFNKK